VPERCCDDDWVRVSLLVWLRVAVPLGDPVSVRVEAAEAVPLIVRDPVTA